MRRYAMLCDAMRCYAMLCDATAACHDFSYYFVWCEDISRNSYDAIRCDATLCDALRCYTTRRYDIKRKRRSRHMIFLKVDVSNKILYRYVFLYTLKVELTYIYTYVHDKDSSNLFVCISNGKMEKMIITVTPITFHHSDVFCLINTFNYI